MFDRDDLRPIEELREAHRGRMKKAELLALTLADMRQPALASEVADAIDLKRGFATREASQRLTHHPQVKRVEMPDDRRYGYVTNEDEDDD